jgi:two-component system, sensor histidine kinase and response regulator
VTEQRRRVLLIDDEEIVLDSCLAILEESEYDLATATGGAAGLEKAQAWGPDLVFVDLKMPGMPGMQVLDEVRSLDPTIVCIVFTGFATIESAVEAMQHGAYDFLAKPFTPEDFRAMVRRGLERRALIVERTALHREREALRENFAAIVSHELRSPLAAVQQNLFVLISELEGVVSENHRQRLKRMSDRIGDLLALVNRWLRGFSVDVAPLRESFQPVAISAPVAKAVESIEGEAVRKAVNVTVHVDPAAMVLGDDGALTEALLNVVGNAAKYSREGGTVAVSAVSRDGEVVISVADTGVGIPASDLPWIFDAFYRGQAGGGEFAGAGIGLALTRRIVEAHGGSITATSEPGRGSVFVIALPALEVPVPGLEATPPEQVSKGEAG